MRHSSTEEVKRSSARYEVLVRITPTKSEKLMMMEIDDYEKK